HQPDHVRFPPPFCIVPVASLRTVACVRAGGVGYSAGDSHDTRCGAMPEFTQKNRRFRVTTAMGADALLLTAFRGTETVSRLFRFELDLVAPADSPAEFQTVLGQPALVELDPPEGADRHFH